MKLSQSSKALKYQQGTRKGRGKLLPVGRTRFDASADTDPIGNRDHADQTLSELAADSVQSPEYQPTQREREAMQDKLRELRKRATTGSEREAAKLLGVPKTTLRRIRAGLRELDEACLQVPWKVRILEYDPFEGRSVLVHFNSGESPQLKKNIRSEKELADPFAFNAILDKVHPPSAFRYIPRLNQYGFVLRTRRDSAIQDVLLLSGEKVQALMTVDRKWMRIQRILGGAQKAA